MYHHHTALEAELDHRRAALQHEAEQHRLARLARLASRAAGPAATRIIPRASHARRRTGHEITGHARA